MVTGTEIAQIITAVATLIVSVGGVFISLRNQKKIQEVHTSTNGKMEEMMRIVKAASFAAGAKSEKDKQEHHP